MVLPTSGCLVPEGQARMSDLAGFLVARFAEDIERARRVHHETCATFDAVSTPLSLPACDCGIPLKAMVYIEAKRQVVAEYERARAQVASSSGSPSDELGGLITAMRCLALPYKADAEYCAGWDVPGAAL
jgi:hypothetical protein